MAFPGVHSLPMTIFHFSKVFVLKIFVVAIFVVVNFVGRASGTGRPCTRIVRGRCDRRGSRPGGDQCEISCWRLVVFLSRLLMLFFDFSLGFAFWSKAKYFVVGENTSERGICIQPK